MGKTAQRAKTSKTKISKETYLQWYETMIRIRRFEEMAQRSYMQQKIRGFLHVYIGQEAVAAGIISATKHTDPIITAYRDHGLALARGLSSNIAMAEMYGKATGSSKGKGGSMHFFDKENFFMGGHGIVGGQIPLGAGIGFAEKYKGTDNVCVCLFGDGAARQGSLHETFNMAMTWKIPTIFICENNHYAMGTSVERTSNVTEISQLGDAYSMPSETIDGMSPESVHEGMLKALKHSREGKGPYFLEIKTYRYKGHSVSDPQKYRTKEEVEEYKKKDPIIATKNKIIKNKIATEKVIDIINKKVNDEINEALKFADESPYPEASAIYEDVYYQKDYPYIKE
ncbi:MAG TPA: pyruvate dehydrogenase (acetyl-transferring) E1 component subunit alpha [Bacteroidetes bacterium]|nr:pyruvate dehydrogenase (acetyl-transferring) E1 component subunit alpha [Bacteroidota bacterium]